MNTLSHRLASFNRQIEQIRVMLSSINDTLGNLQTELVMLKTESTNKTEINNIPINQITLISEEELKTKLSNDMLRTARIIKKQEEDDDSNEYILVATDGSVCTERERRSAAFAVIFSDTSPLNIVENTNETSSSTLPEI